MGHLKTPRKAQQSSKSPTHRTFADAFRVDLCYLLPISNPMETNDNG